MIRLHWPQDFRNGTAVSYAAQGFGYTLLFPLVTGEVPIHDQFVESLLLQVQNSDIATVSLILILKGSVSFPCRSASSASSLRYGSMMAYPPLFEKRG